MVAPLARADRAAAPPAPASRRKRYPRPEGSNMMVQARNRSQVEDSLRRDQSSSKPQSTIENAESSMSGPDPCQQLTRMITSYWVSRAIYIAAKLRIADHLKDGPRTAEELATAAGVAPRPLYRVLRALAGQGVFAHEADGRFQLNPLAEPLRDGGPDSLRAFAVLLGEEQYRSW